MTELERTVRALLAQLPQPESRGYPTCYARLQIEAVQKALADLNTKEPTHG